MTPRLISIFFAIIALGVLGYFIPRIGIGIALGVLVGAAIFTVVYAVFEDEWWWD